MIACRPRTQSVLELSQIGTYKRFDRAPPRRRKAGPPRPRGPALVQEDSAVVLSLTVELRELCDAHSRLADTTNRELTTAAGDFVRYKCKSLEAVNRLTNDSKRFSLDDIRRVERKGVPDIAFILELFGRLPVNTHVEQPGDKIRFTEIDIPRALLPMEPSLSNIGGVIRPGQSMCNWMQNELAKGTAEIASYRPYLVP